MQPGESGLQVRLPQVLISITWRHWFPCDAGVTQWSGIGRKLGSRLLENRLAHEPEKRANHTPLQAKLPEPCTETLDSQFSVE